MKKVAFLVLSYNSFTQPDYWQNFFSQIPRNSYNLYIHSKNKPQCFFSKFFIKKRVPTAWGQFSLVEATIELMKASLIDHQNEYFVLISDSHFPLLQGEKTIDAIKKKCRCLVFSGDNKKRRGKPKGVENYEFENKVVSQFFMCRREHVEKFVESFDFYSQFFVKNSITFADEFYFFAVAHDLKMRYLFSQNLCFIDWSNHFDKQGKLLKKPYVFPALDSTMINELINKEYLFIRKISQNTRLHL